ncbi:hypothetical protein quinque_005499, partial [Culex quinquefasciatus]
GPTMRSEACVPLQICFFFIVSSTASGSTRFLYPSERRMTSRYALNPCCYLPAGAVAARTSRGWSMPANLGDLFVSCKTSFNDEKTPPSDCRSDSDSARTCVNNPHGFNSTLIELNRLNFVTVPFLSKSSRKQEFFTLNGRRRRFGKDREATASYLR